MKKTSDKSIVASIVVDDRQHGTDIGDLFMGAANAFEVAAESFQVDDAEAANAALDVAAQKLIGDVRATAVARQLLLADADGQHRGAVEAEAPTMADAVIVYDGFFGITRRPCLLAADVAVAAAPAVLDLAAALPTVPIPLDDRAVLARQAAELLRRGRHVGGMVIDVDSVPLRTPVDALARWKLGHVFFGLASRSAAAGLRSAVGAFEEGDAASAASAVGAACEDVRAVTAGMELAAATSGRAYGGSIRPTMRPPALPIELTGFQNLDYADYKRQLAAFLQVFHQPYVELARMSPAVAIARDRLLHLDLTDLERHIALTYRLVGAVPALDEDPSGSAVQALRASYVRRLRAYGPLLRHGTITDEALAE